MGRAAARARNSDHARSTAVRQHPDGHMWELTGPLEPPAAHGYAVSPPRLPRRIAEPEVAAGQGGAVASGNPYATAAAHSILLAGGTAAEAAIAAAAVLGVVEPYNGGLGGDLFAIIAAPYDAGVPSSPRETEASQRGRMTRPLRVTSLNAGHPRCAFRVTAEPESRAWPLRPRAALGEETRVRAQTRSTRRWRGWRRPAWRRAQAGRCRSCRRGARAL
mmetsp:Transcript_8935/g.22750  ORF Transcript_8935/g.22750 Transcript_8935/m.22750 type:complete len:219 (-) Transcript_8935:1202-1858(-)